VDSSDISQKETPSASTGETQLKVSVVIPVRNEEPALPALIASLKEQTFPPAEIIFVDGGSIDQTVALSRELFAGDHMFRLLEAGPATPGRGRNLGIEAAQYDWLALTDGGSRVEPQWLERLVEVSKRDPAIAFVYGNFEPITDSFFTRCAALAYVHPKRPVEGGSMRYPSIASALMRREVWKSVGGFPDLRAAEDLMFMEAMEKQGFKTGYAPYATIHWHLQPTLLTTFRKFVLYSRHNVWAGRQRYWHYGIARQYAIAVVFIILGAVHSKWWWWLPALALLARVAKRIWKNREGRGVIWTLNPIQFLGVMLVMLTIDLATFVGWLQAKFSQPQTE